MPEGIGYGAEAEGMSPEAVRQRFQALSRQEKNALISVMDSKVGPVVAKVMGPEFSTMVDRAVQAKPKDEGASTAANSDPSRRGLMARGPRASRNPSPSDV